MLMGLEVDRVSKAFETHAAVSEVSLRVPEGEFVCFLGPSGCGKTTLLRMIAGLEMPTSGRILFNGADITRDAAHARNFGMVFQALALFPHLSVADNIGYSLRLRGMERRMRDERVQELLALVDLPGLGARRVDQLSGGQRQRVAIARALAQEPRLFLMDEPLSALDAKLRDHMQVEIRQLQQKLKITTIFVTHDQREAMTIADRVVVMAGGRIQQVSTPAEIYRRPANRFVASFIGQSNLLDVAVSDPGVVTFRGAPIVVDAVPEGAAPGAPATLCIRPEDVVLSPASTDGIRGKISFVRDLGSAIEVRLQCEDAEIIAALSSAQWHALPSHEDACIEFAERQGTVLTQ